MNNDEFVNAIERGQISLFHVGNLLKRDNGQTHQDWGFLAYSFTPHKEQAEGATAKEAVENLLKKLDML